MDAFVRRLVQRLFDPAKPLSRNRHFHTFDNPPGKKALTKYKRLQALTLDIERCHKDGGKVTVARVDDGDRVKVDVKLERLRGRRVTTLEEDELVLLRQLPGMATLLGHSSQ